MKGIWHNIRIVLDIIINLMGYMISLVLLVSGFAIFYYAVIISRYYSLIVFAVGSIILSFIIFILNFSGSKILPVHIYASKDTSNAINNLRPTDTIVVLLLIFLFILGILINIVIFDAQKIYIPYIFGPIGLISVISCYFYGKYRDKKFRC